MIELFAVRARSIAQSRVGATVTCLVSTTTSLGGREFDLGCEGRRASDRLPRGRSAARSSRATDDSDVRLAAIIHGENFRLEASRNQHMPTSGQSQPLFSVIAHLADKGSKWSGSRRKSGMKAN
jgi:hypothetical protein